MNFAKEKFNSINLTLSLVIGTAILFLPSANAIAGTNEAPLYNPNINVKERTMKGECQEYNTHRVELSNGGVTTFKGYGLLNTTTTLDSFGTLTHTYVDRIGGAKDISIARFPNVPDCE